MRAAFYECDVTPPLNVIPSMRLENLPLGMIENRRYAKAVVIENSGSVIALLTVDSLFIPPDMHSAVTKRISEYTRISSANVSIISSDTLSDIMADDDLKTNLFADDSYRDYMFRLSADAVIMAYKNLAEVELSFANPHVAGITYCYNRDNYNLASLKSKIELTDKDLFPPTPDRTFPILYFKNNGKVIGTISCFACRLDKTSNSHISKRYVGDYSLLLAQNLKEQYGDDFVSIYLLGCSRDVTTFNPSPLSRAFGYIEIANELSRIIITQERFAKAVTSDDVVSIKDTVIEKRSFYNLPKRFVDMLLIPNCVKSEGQSKLFIHEDFEFYTTELYVQGVIV